MIAASVLWIYWPALHGDWLWDDSLYITDNPLLRNPDRLWKAWFEPGSFVEYYPIQETVQWLQWQLWGMDTLGYHLTNVFLHILSALLVWRLLSKFGLRLAWLGGLIFAIHPVQVESVAWIVELKNTLSLPPFLLAMCAWIDYEERGKARDYWLALGLFLIAMLCKITMATFPVVILLHAWWKRDRIVWNDIKTSLPFWLISLALGFATIWVGQHYQEYNHDSSDVIILGGNLSKLACAGLAFAFYFSKCFLPVDLMPTYPQWIVDPPMLWQFLPWVVFGCVISWLWTKRESWGRHALLGLGFFLILLAPFLGFKSISYMSFTWVMDHFLYIPIIGLIGLFVAALGQLEIQLPASFRLYGTGLIIAALACLAFASRGYAAIYVNSVTLWTYEIQQNPHAYLAHNNLGSAFFKEGQLTEAEAQFEESMQIKPNDANTHNNLGSILVQLGRPSDAISQYEEALRIAPDFGEAHDNLGLAFLQTGQVDQAKEQFEQALRTKPDNAEANYNLGTVLFKAGQMPEAIMHYRHAIQVDPNYAEAHNNLGAALLNVGQISEAGAEFQQALQIKPDYTAARNNLARLQALQKTVPPQN